jgi:integrase
MRFGCGLRLFVCLQLRVRDFNFDAGVLDIHGKEKKDVPCRCRSQLFLN